jgi:hypothetical protein
MQSLDQGRKASVCVLNLLRLRGPLANCFAIFPERLECFDDRGLIYYLLFGENTVDACLLMIHSCGRWHCRYQH